MPAKKKAPEKLDCVPKVRSQRKQAKRNEVKARRRKLRIVPRAPVSKKDAGTETLPLEQITLSFS
jgi:hypothetical protein